MRRRHIRLAFHELSTCREPKMCPSLWQPVRQNLDQILRRVAGECVQQWQFLRSYQPLRKISFAPPIPIGGFAAIQHVVISDDIDLHKPQAIHLTVAECLRIDRLSTAFQPGFSCRHEIVTRYVGWVELDLFFLFQHPVDLRVAQMPASGCRVPIFTNPMILPSLREVGGEATAHACRNAFAAKDRRQGECEIAARAGGSSLCRAPAVERLRVSGEHIVETFGDRQCFSRRCVQPCQVETVFFCPIGVNEHALNNIIQSPDLVRQFRHQGPVMDWIGHPTMDGPALLFLQVALAFPRENPDQRGNDIPDVCSIAAWGICESRNDGFSRSCVTMASGPKRAAVTAVLLCAPMPAETATGRNRHTA